MSLPLCLRAEVGPCLFGSLPLLPAPCLEWLLTGFPVRSVEEPSPNWGDSLGGRTEWWPGWLPRGAVYSSYSLSQNKKVFSVWNTALVLLGLAGMAARFVLGVWMRTKQVPWRTALSPFAELSLKNGNHSNRVSSFLKCLLPSSGVWWKLLPRL